MTTGQLLNGLASALVMVVSLVFIISYLVLAKWYKSSTGRFLMIKAVGICLTGAITVSLTLRDFQVDSDWLRWAQAGLWTIIAAAYAHHIWLMWRIQRKRGDLGDQGN